MATTCRRRRLLSLSEEEIVFAQHQEPLGPLPQPRRVLRPLLGTLAGLAFLAGLSAALVAIDVPASRGAALPLALGGVVLMAAAVALWVALARAARREGPPPRFVPASVEVVRFCGRSRTVRLLGPVRERVLDDAHLLSAEAPLLAEVPLDCVDLDVSFHRSLPWSDVYSDGDDEFDAVAVSLWVRSSHPGLSEAFDLLDGVAADVGFTVLRTNPEAERRRCLAARLLGRPEAGGRP